jgi:hypothetical protein
MTGLTRETVTRIIDRWEKECVMIMGNNRHMLIRHSFFEENPDL